MSLSGCQWTFPLESDAGSDTDSTSSIDTDSTSSTDTDSTSSTDTDSTSSTDTDSTSSIPIDTSSWTRRIRITVDSARVAEDLTDFPVLISFDSNVSLSSDARDDGHDILFTDESSIKKLDHEIEQFDNSTGRLVAWVRVPFLSSTEETSFYLYFGKQNATDQSNATGVWDSGYKGVWHLKENGNGTIDEYLDSTSNNNHGRGGSGAPIEAPTQNTSGKIFNAQDFDNVDDHIYVAHSASLGITADITLSAWIKLNSLVNTYGIILAKTNSIDLWDYSFYPGTSNGLYIYADWAIPEEVGSNSGVISATDRWYYVTITRGGGIVKFYVDGNAIGAAASMTGIIKNNAIPVFIGYDKDVNRTSQFDGSIDELRLSNVARSPGWISTSFNNQNSISTFYSIGSPEILH